MFLICAQQGHRQRSEGSQGSRLPQTTSHAGFCLKTKMGKHTHTHTHSHTHTHTHTPPWRAPSRWRCSLSLTQERRSFIIIAKFGQKEPPKTHKWQAPKLVLSWNLPSSSVFVAYTPNSEQGGIYLCFREAGWSQPAAAEPGKEAQMLIFLQLGLSLSSMAFKTFLYTAGKRWAVWCQTAAAFYCISQMSPLDLGSGARQA